MLTARLMPLLKIPHELSTIPGTLLVISTALLRELGRAVSRPWQRKRMLRIAIDVRPFYEPLTGIGWYEHHLLTHWSRRDDVTLIPVGEPWVTDAGPHLHSPLPGDLEPLLFDMRGRRVGRTTRRLCALAHPLLIRLAGADVHFAPNYFLPRGHSSVATTLVVAVHDLTFKRFPHLLQQETLENLEARMARELTRADAVICVSEATRTDMIELFDVDPRRAHTILSGLGNRPEKTQARLDLPDHYALFVSTIEPRKNVEAILAAAHLLWEQGRWTGDLVLAGRVGWKADGVIQQIEESRWRHRIHRFDYLPPETLSTLYARAEMFVLPSWYEGFGFPLLEAMAAGVPSIAARTSSLPEVGGDAALYVDPAKPGELADAMERLSKDVALREHLRIAGPIRAAQFDWAVTAVQTLRVLRRAAGAGSDD